LNGKIDAIHTDAYTRTTACKQSRIDGVVQWLECQCYQSMVGRVPRPAPDLWLTGYSVRNLSAS